MAIREWVEAATTLGPPPGSRIWTDWNAFQTFFKDYLGTLDYTPDELDKMAVGEFMKFVREWRAQRPTGGSQ